MVKVIYSHVMHDCEHLLGTFLDENHYDVLVDYDADVYGPSLDGSKTEENIVAKFRKGVISAEEQRMAYEGLREAAVQSQNRGIAAGPRGERLQADGRGGRDWVTDYQIEVLEFLTRPLNVIDDSETLETIKARHDGKKGDPTRGHVWLRSKITTERGEYDGWFDRWLSGIHNKAREEQKKEAEYVRDNYISETNYAQSVMSGVAGFYGRYPRIPWGRACSYNEKNPEKFEMAFPFLRNLSNTFKEILPQRWAAQKAACDRIDKRFVIDDTVFTTLTVNHNWRTAAHYDAGDLGPGFSNICGFGKGWAGGELICPQYRVAFNIQPGDMLFVANHTAIHGNNTLRAPAGMEEPDRLTVVSYFREDLFEVKSWEYEQLRRKFVEERRQNKNHPEWRKLWNGVSPGMWASQEWADYLAAHGMEDEDGVVSTKINSLESFFG